MLRGSAGDTAERAVAYRPAGVVTRITRQYRGDTLVLETLFETADGAVALIDFMTIEPSTVVRIVEGRCGVVPCCLELVLRFDYGISIPWVTPAAHRAWHPRGLWRGASGRPRRHPAAGQGHDHRRRFHRERRAARPVQPEPRSIASEAAPRRRGSRRGAERGGGALARMVRSIHLSRAVALTSAPVAADTQGADRPPHGGDRRRGHDLAPGENRRHPQLGLPVLLATRFEFHAARFDQS